jgi:RNA polymerase sigma-70 factor, ECF subfamily
MSNETRAQDGWIVLRCQSGDPRAFEDLVRTLERPLLYYATKLAGSQTNALDVLQETWLLAFRGIRRLKDPESLRPWLYRIAHGVAVDRIRRSVARARAEEAHLDGAVESVEPEFSAGDSAVIHRALDELEPAHREVLVLHFLEDFSVAEIAGIVKCPEGTVKSRMFHAKRAMRALLERGGYGPR